MNDAGDTLDAQHRVLDSRGSYRAELPPHVATVLDSFADRWEHTLTQLAQAMCDTGTNVEQSRVAYEDRDGLVCWDMRTLDGRN
ncbi:hypothetical protein GXB85_13405 [Cellulomonas sp. APG4]|uniref:hypothetical protein n=1 Tax=Cellulomonas sp. APG4 TaxID=1538656 RepID=UPI0013798C41|nr:hypothetical protein [Cellulomonas sp. APG4]NCT91939.1 hypothetical protein [Cellulomonas sp. APG4]